MQNQNKTAPRPAQPAGGRRPWRRLLRSPLFDVIQFLVLLLAAAWFFAKSIADAGYTWHWQQVPRYLYTLDGNGLHAGPLLDCLAVTLQISAVSLLFAFVIGLVAALLRLPGSFIGRSTARAYLEVIRNTPPCSSRSSSSIFPGQGFGPGQHHRRLRPDHAGPGHYRRNLSHL